MTSAPARTARESLLDEIEQVALPVTGSGADYQPLLDRVRDERFVLIGEASHGTLEFYRERAEITKRLIVERGFNAVAVEADWPDAYRVNRYVRGVSDDASADDALGGFKRFPAWMWRNSEVLDFVAWLRDHNREIGMDRAAGFYGLDLYSLYSSIDAVITYLDGIDPEAAARARYRYSCFGDAEEDGQAYGYAAAFDLERSCEDEAVRQLVELRQRAGTDWTSDGSDIEARFNAEQNARVVRNAERYYRSMFGDRVSSWNLRDRHMTDTLDALAAHIEARGRIPRIVVWAHNSHLGDARATEMNRRGESNIGQMARERHGAAVLNIGLTTYRGEVTAASEWGAAPERKRVRRGLPGSYEALFHEVDAPRFMLMLRDDGGMRQLRARLERAIGVIYRPQSELISHYFEADLYRQFDVLLHIDETSALPPLEREQEWIAGEPPETYPFGR